MIQSLDVLLKQADRAMYRAKAHGRGRVCHFDPELSVEVAAVQSVERDMERRLRAAIELQALTLHYQPVVELPTGRVIGAEALCRWHDPELGSVPPDQFISVAERTGLILDLGAWVLTEACTKAAGWLGQPGRPAPSVAVNVSAVQLGQPKIVDQVVQALSLSGLDPHRLCLEITETAAIDDLDEAAGRLGALRELGVRLALDDFGTGHSSLTMLRRLPIHLVKIDRSFVKDITSRAQDAVMVRLVIDTAHNLGPRVCAEGVEHAEQARQLTAMGADTAQGWFFGMPEPDSPRLAQLMARPVEAADDLEMSGVLLGGSNELIVVTSPDRVITYASASSGQLLGWMPRDMIGQPVTHFLHPEAVGRMQAGEIFPGMMQDGTITHRARHRDGSYRWLDTRTQFLADEDGTVREVLSVSRDVTEIVRTTEALLDSEAKFRHAFDNNPTAMTVTDAQGSFIQVNNAFADLLGLPTEVLLTRSFQDVTYDYEQTTDEHHRTLLAPTQTQPRELDTRLVHANGQPVPVHVRATTVSRDSGDCSYLVAHITPDEPPGLKERSVA